MAKQAGINGLIYKHDTHIEKSHLELGILIEELIEERDAWRNVADSAIGRGPLQCGHDDADWTAHPRCNWCRAIGLYEKAVLKYGLD